MVDATPFTLRWGIISTGKIASVFVSVKFLITHDASRGVNDVIHTVVAVGSRNVLTAQEFINAKAGGEKSIKAYGSYDEVFADPVIYIGTPHTYHYENALAAIKARKHVLVEKPATTNAAEFRSLIQAANEYGVFIMEAMWTRFLPISLAIKKIAESGILGNPIVLHADLSADFGIDNLPLTHRIIDPKLGGGGLLDLGPYPFVWAIMAIYEHPSNISSRPVTISSSMLKTPLTGVDANTSFTLTFPSSQAILTTSINLNSSPFGCTIRYERGSIIITPPIYCPKQFTVQYHNDAGKVVKEEKQVVEHVGGGWHFQADEVARCVRDGRKESEIWTHGKTLLEMEVFDNVRHSGGYILPPGVEKVM
ncbi:Trans-1,2-dihydrobenzene-1,2-diol dehydrogenase [Leucoagaricus sp. SymC.cos]|nr:Trans-1,2-dihydrobenzene-1,2-diol dehydrogenase [Leucoagaricus sp. SymC.cos]